MKSKFIYVCFVVLLITAIKSTAQNSIQIITLGKDLISIKNLTPHAIRVDYQNKKPLYIYKRGNINISFALTVSNVRNTTFKVSYDSLCYNMDVAICQGIYNACIGCDLFTLLLPKDLGSAPALLGCTPEQLQSKNDPSDTKTRGDRILEALGNNVPVSEKKIVYWTVCRECCKENELRDQIDCIRRAKYYLDNPPPIQQYKAQDLIVLLNQFSFDVYPYYLSGFKQPGFANLPFSQRKYYGFRTSLNFALYEKKRRTKNQITVPFDFQQTPIVYYKNANPALPDTGYAWKNFSLGVGVRVFNYQNVYTNLLRTFAILVDIGLSKNSRTKYAIDSSKRITSVADDTKSAPLGGYFNFGFQVDLFRGVGLYASYYTNIIFKKNQPLLDVPRLRQGNVGLYINLFNKYSYQY